MLVVTLTPEGTGWALLRVALVVTRAMIASGGWTMRYCEHWKFCDSPEPVCETQTVYGLLSLCPLTSD